MTRTVYDIRLGDRVQLHPATDSWARGDRFGTVEGITRNGKLRIRMDKSGELCRTDPLNVLEIVSRGELL